MFAHWADETRNLSHAFLGALFSVLLVFSDKGFVGVFFCSISLYANFLILLVTIHYLFKAMTKKEMNEKYYIATVSLFIFCFLQWVAIFIVFGTPFFNFFIVEHKPAVMVGILLYLLFSVNMVFAHVTAMRSREGKQEVRAANGS